MLEGFIKGFVLNLALVSTFGPQNVTLVSLGLNRNYVYTFATVCVVCDFFLIYFSIFSPFILFKNAAIFEFILSGMAVIFLYYFSFKNFINAFFFSRTSDFNSQKVYSRKNIISMGLTLSLLNPAILGETLVIIGGVSKQFLKLEEEICFLIGTMLVSFIWFFGMSVSLKKTSSIIKNNKFYIFFYIISGVLLFITASTLIENLYVNLMNSYLAD